MNLSPWPGQRPKRNRSKLKQVSLWLPLDVWQRLRSEAARQNIPLTDLCRRLMQPGLDGLPPAGT